MPFVPLQDFADHTSKWVKLAHDGEPVVVASNRQGGSYVRVKGLGTGSRLGTSATETSGKVLTPGLSAAKPRTREEPGRPAGSDRRHEYVPMRDLSRMTHKIMGQVRDHDKIAVVTVRGKPLVLIERVDMDALAALVIGQSKEFRKSFAEAEQDLASGDARTLDEFIDELS